VVSTRTGKLFSFGSNAEGQLGLGKSIEYADIPKEITCADVIKEEVAQLAAGSAHTMALGKKTGTWKK
jgi:alpha-tubulin suppressor-like RCC1 family protein